MKNLCYKIGDDRSRFPVMMYKVGELESVWLTATVPFAYLGKKCLYYIKSIYITESDKERKFKDDEYVIILYTAAELSSKVQQLKIDLEKAKADFAKEMYAYELIHSEIKRIDSDFFKKDNNWNYDINLSWEQELFIEYLKRLEAPISVNFYMGTLPNLWIIIPETIFAVISYNEKIIRTQVTFFPEEARGVHR